MTTDPQFLPQNRTSLVPGNYSLSITGPQGLLLNVTIDISKRGVLSGQFEETGMLEILAVHSVAEGWIIAQNEIQHRQRQLTGLSSSTKEAAQ